MLMYVFIYLEHVYYATFQAIFKVNGKMRNTAMANGLDHKYAGVESIALCLYLPELPLANVLLCIMGPSRLVRKTPEN